MTETKSLPAPYSRSQVLEPLAAVGRALHRRRARGPRLGAYDPISTLEGPGHRPERAAVSAIDFHSHLGRWLSSSGRWMEEDVGRLLEVMDRCNIAALVNLDGRWGRELDENLGRYDLAHPGRFFTFCHVDWRLLDRANGPEELARSLEDSVAKGARGLKVWKDVGLEVQARGRKIQLDDPLLDPLWRMAGQLGVPVLMHVGDLKAYFLPPDLHNERLEELLRYPRLRRPGGLVEYHRQLECFEHVVASHPGTKIVAAHGLRTENLEYVSKMLARYPNLSIDMGWRAQELGRQPYAARSLLTRHADQVLFGTDCFPVTTSAYRTYFRLLETADDAFNYSEEAGPGKCRWSLYGLELSPLVLAKIYRHNAASLLTLAVEDAGTYQDRAMEIRSCQSGVLHDPEGVARARTSP